MDLDRASLARVAEHGLERAVRVRLHPEGFVLSKQGKDFSFQTVSVERFVVFEQSEASILHEIDVVHDEFDTRIHANTRLDQRGPVFPN